MTLKDLIEQLRIFQETAPEADVLIENGEWCDRIQDVKLRYYGRDPMVIIVNPENLRGH